MSSTLMGYKTYGKITANAGTRIVQLIEPCVDAWTMLGLLEYTAGATGHVLTVMKPLGVTTLTAAAAASQAVVNIAADPGDYTGKQVDDNGIAASDRVVVELSDGTYFLTTVSSVATLAITLAASLPYAAAVNAKFWFFGVEANTNPFDARAHETFNLDASGATIFGSDVPNDTGWFCSNNIFEPLILSIDNATNAGVLERVTALYGRRASLRTRATPYAA